MGYPFTESGIHIFILFDFDLKYSNIIDGLVGAQECKYQFGYSRYFVGKVKFLIQCYTTLVEVPLIQRGQVFQVVNKSSQ